MRWRSHAREFSDPSGRAAANVIRMGISLAARCNTSTAMLFQRICHAWFKRDFIIN